MSLTNGERRSLADAANFGYRGEHPLVMGLVEQIVARHIAEALSELDARCCSAEFSLRDMAAAHPLIADRLESKRQGVALVRDYIRAAMPPP